MKSQKIYYPLIVLALLGATYCFNSRGDLTSTGIRKVIDGDTVILADGSDSRLRYIGIDSPEMLTFESPGEPFSEQAKKLNEDLLKGKSIRLEFDREEYDQFGRMLGYVYADDLLINEQLLKQGLAVTLQIEPNTKYTRRFLEAEQFAQKNKRGIWSDIDYFKTPAENRDFLIKPVSADKYIGQRVVVRGKISDYRKSDKVIVLSMENDFDVVIFQGSWKNFSYFGIEPQEYYVGFPVEVIGRVKLYRGKSQIIVDHPITIKRLK